MGEGPEAGSKIWRIGFDASLENINGGASRVERSKPGRELAYRTYGTFGRMIFKWVFIQTNFRMKM